MKRQSFLLFFILSYLALGAQEELGYSRVKISLIDKGISELAATGIDVTEGFYKADSFLETDLSSLEIAALQEAGFEFQILIDDVSHFYEQRAEAEKDLQIVRSPADEFPVPENWEYGSMGGFYTLDQVMEKLDFMTATWPEFVSERQIIDPENLTINGQPMWWIKISNEANGVANKPQVLYTSLIHSREGIGVQQMIYYMFWLLENYESNPTAKTIVDNIDLYFIPVINPDGYVHNQQTNPNGGGMWRKNRRNNGDGSYGVDLNRNFGYKWGYDNTGSSPDPYSETYRGIAGFSEIETQNIRQFVETHDFKIALNYHSYSNLLLYPWGWTAIPCDDDAIFEAFAILMTRDNKYTYGPSSTTIYPTNGSSDDYMYGDNQNKAPIFAYTPEVGSNNDGFWPSISRIIPLCQENMIQNIYAALLAGSYGNITDKTETIINQQDFYFVFDLQRLGLSETDHWSISIEESDEWITATGDVITTGYLNIMESLTDSILIQLDPAILSGQSFQFVVKVDNGNYVQTDTITKMFGATTIVFEDECSSLDNWIPGNWGLTTASFISPPSSITDSPNGNYPNNNTNIITLAEAVDIPATSYALLSYWAKWDIEAGWDYAQILIKPDNAIGWTPLEGKYTTTGTSYQSPGKPVYDGTSGWVKEEIDLTDYAGRSIQLRFQLVSDVYVSGDGFYFDDIQIIALDVETGIETYASSSQQIRVSPNPATEIITVYVDHAFKTGQQMEILDIAGRQVMQLQPQPGSHSLQQDISHLKKGMYLLRIEGVSNVRKFVVQ
ncbi:MAG: M14 family zinc carboxypeptidase [Bacteroidales bacterium]|jgi:murein tripeptide amidase MpaA|nr:immune inhibitor A [Bacteroidales bacterium]MDY0368827.1 M14 family zinc carboxypeptidase [Bacteroidales bacterium]